MNKEQNFDNMPKVKRESKNKIRVEFERTPLKERLKAKFLSLFFLQKAAWYIFRLVLLVGISYIVLYPFISKIMGSFMAPENLIDPTVILIPKNWTLDTYKYIYTNTEYMTAFLNTLLLSGSTAILQTFTCAVIAYGLAKFKFKASKYIFLAVVVTMVIPHATLGNGWYHYFSEFDILGIFKLLGGGGVKLIDTFVEWCSKIVDKVPSGGFEDFVIVLGDKLNEFNVFLKDTINIAPHTVNSKGKVFYDSFWNNGGFNLNNSYWPMMILSITGLGFKNGLYIFLLRQFFRGVPDELEESAYMDGSGVIRTFVKVIIPLSVPMLITVFIFAFSWQWTDEFYVTKFFGDLSIPFLSRIPQSAVSGFSEQAEWAGQYKTIIRNTAGLMIITPLIILYVFCQKYLVQGIERSGLTAD